MTGHLRGAGPEPFPGPPGPPRGLLPDDAWHGWFALYDHVLLVTVAAVPLAALAVWALARRRRAAGAPPASARLTALAEVGIVLAMLPALWLTMAPGAEAGSVPGRVSLVPLQDLPHMGTVQTVGNLLILAVPGFLAPVRFRGLASLPRVLAAAAAASASIETAQYVLQLDRVSSVDDVLLNTAGAGLAALASRRWWRERREPDLAASRRAAVV